MKFSVGSSELLKVLTKASTVIPSKSTLPILENYLLELTKDELRVTATDLEISISTTLKVNGERDGKIAVPAKRIVETMRALPNIPVQFTADISSNKITLSTNSGEYKMTGESSDEYPTTAQFKGTEDITINSELFARIIGRTSFAVSTDELRPAMMGVLMQIRKNELRAVATDGHRLVRMTDTAFRSPKLEREIIIPAKALNVISKSLEENANTLSIDTSYIKFNFGSTVVISRLIEEKYPNYEAVIPTDNEKIMTVEKNALLTAVRRIALYASTTTHQVRFTMKKNTVVISAEDVDFGSEANESIACQYTAEPMEIGFNASYIIDILSHVESDEVALSLSSPTRAGIVKPAQQKEGEDLLMLVMPVRLNA